MDIDPPENTVQSRTDNKRPALLPVDDARPFDLEAYIASYSGRTVVNRLIQIIKTCPSIASQALKLSYGLIRQMRDPTLYTHLVNTYEQLSSMPSVQVPPLPAIISTDTRWLDDLSRKNQAEKTKLEVELKTYTNNMIKESIRMGHRDLGDFYRSTGDYTTAMKNYTKSREYCTTSQHIIDMCLSVLELLIEQKNYAQIPTYVFKADAALETTAAASSNATNAPTGSQAASNKKSSERDKTQSKLDLATAISHLGQGNYQKAATTFLKVGPAQQLDDWIGKVVAPADIAIYGTLCALSSFSRSAIKAQLLDNDSFANYIEQEPYVRELIEAYMSSNFKIALDVLSRYSTRHYVDIHLGPHVWDLTRLIRHKAIMLYFQPFATIKLDRMSSAFGWTVEDVESEVVSLIQSGQIEGRVDSQNKVLHAKKTDYRAELFARTMKAGADIKNTNRKLLLRMRLQQADLVVKPSRSQQSQGPQSDLMQGD